MLKTFKRFLTWTLVLSMVVACFCLPVAAAPGGGPGGPGGPGGQGGGFAYGDYTNGDQILTLKEDGNFTFSLGEGQESISGTYTTQQVSGNFGMTNTAVTFDETATASLKDIYGWYWKGTVTLGAQQMGPGGPGGQQGSNNMFTPDLDMDQTKVPYTAKTAANASSATGYTTTITVSDPGHTYQNVYAYGMWMASPTEAKNGGTGNSESDYDTSLYAPEDWKNGMYYSGYGSCAMTYDTVASAWSLSLDLASASMELTCCRDIVNEKDLENVKISDDERVQIPYDAVKQSKSFDWSVTADSTQAGKINTVNLSDDIKLSVYTPYGYDAADASTRYPVLYLIPGMMTEYDTWFTGGKANVIFDNLIAEDKIAPTIIVTTTRDAAKMDYDDVWDTADDRSKQNGDGDGYINYAEGTAKGSGTGNMIHSPVVTAIIPYIDAHYNTAADADHRAIAGTSMGGVATTQIWMTDHEMFSAYGFFSGVDMYFKASDDAKAADEYKALRNTYKADYEALLSDAKSDMAGKAVIVGGGITDRNAFGGDQNSAGADNLHSWLVDNGIDHKYAIVGGGHDWITWTQLLTMFTNALSDSDTWAVETAAPALKVESNTILGKADTENFSTLKAYTDAAQTVPGQQVAYSGKVVLGGLNANALDLSSARVALVAGDGYYVEDMVFNGGHLSVQNNKLVFTMHKGDLEWNNYGYPVKEGGMEWSCIGGDGSGRYRFNLTLSGVKYGGMTLDSVTFPINIYIYGREFSAQSSPSNPASGRWGAGGYDDLELPTAVKADPEKTVAPGSEPIWTWNGDGDEPILCDLLTDNFFITWPVGVDASGIGGEDVTITLRSQYGDSVVLTPTIGDKVIPENGIAIPNGDYSVFPSKGQTQISVNLVLWAATPVYNTMTIEVKESLIKAHERQVYSEK